MLAVPQPPVELIACHGGRYRIRYPACEEWPEGDINALDPAGRPAFRIVPTATAASGC